MNPALALPPNPLPTLMVIRLLPIHAVPTSDQGSRSLITMTDTTTLRKRNPRASTTAPSTAATAVHDPDPVRVPPNTNTPSLPRTRIDRALDLVKVTRLNTIHLLNIARDRRHVPRLPLELLPLPLNP